VRSHHGRPQRRRHRHHPGSGDPGARAAVREPGLGCLRPAAGRRRRVHRGGPDLGHGALPVLRGRRPLDAAHPGSRGQGRPGRPGGPGQRGRGRRGARGGL
ncbi:MAG: Sulfur metabolism protein SseC, partial [uncultured Friedmanniella sp.]